MDHDRVNFAPTQISCGISQLYGITDSSNEDVLFAIGTRLYHPSRGQPVAAFIYSNTVEDKRGVDFFKAASLFGFGGMQYSEEMLNPKTGNVIRMTTWHINHVNFRKWWIAEKLKRLKANV
jgi:hypothetical protein